MKSFVERPTPEQGAANLTPAQIDVLRALLAEAFEEQRTRLRHAEQVISSFDGSSESAMERELARGQAENAFDLLHGIRKALEDLDAGRYGVCSNCGRSIPFERLEALPRTTRCVACS